MLHLSKVKDKKYMAISVDAEKAFNKIQHLLILKTLNRLGIEEMYCNMIKAI